MAAIRTCSKPPRAPSLPTTNGKARRKRSCRNTSSSAARRHGRASSINSKNRPRYRSTPSSSHPPGRQVEGARRARAALPAMRSDSSDSAEARSRNSAGVDTHEFFLPGAGVSALLIHGLTGTPYEMRYLGERLAARGVRVRGVKLAGHAGTPEELGAAGYDNWYESVVNGLEELRQYGEPNEVVAGLAMLAPAFFLPTSTTIMLRGMRGMLGSLVGRIYLLNPGGSDIHDAATRSIHPSCRLMPLSAPMKLLDLSAVVKPMLARIAQPALVMHARRDHTCPMRKNVNYVMKHLGGSEKRAVELDESYHVITVDSEKERVAVEVIEFVAQRARVILDFQAGDARYRALRRRFPGPSSLLPVNPRQKDFTLARWSRDHSSRRLALRYSERLRASTAGRFRPGLPSVRSRLSFLARRK